MTTIEEPSVLEEQDNTRIETQEARKERKMRPVVIANVKGLSPSGGVSKVMRYLYSQ